MNFENMKLLAVFVLFTFITSGFCQSFCRTPNGESARCTSLYSCQIFMNAIRSNPTSEVQRFLKDSQCGYTNVPLVCCGSVATYQQLPPTFTPARPIPAPIRAPQTNQNASPSSHRNYNLLPRIGQCGEQVYADKVVGGNETELDEFPWMALLEYRKNGVSTGRSCGGVLISSKYLLTAAHCVVGPITQQYGNLYRVRLGEYDTSTNRDCRIIYEGESVEICADPVQDIDVEEVIPHPNYNLDDQEHNDIALIRLRHPANINDYVKPICLPLNKERSAVGSEITVAGWGQTEYSTNSNIKLKANMPVVSEDQCTRTYSKLRRQLTENQFCAGGLRGVDSCKGDSGGPIMAKWQRQTLWYVEGIVSYGPFPCGQPGWPGVYTRVSSYVNWILDGMRP